MKFLSRLLPLLIVLSFSLTIFAFALPLMTAQPKTQMTSAPAKPKSQNTVDLESDQGFSVAPGSTSEFNIYIKNKGKSTASYTLTTLSNHGYNIEVWRDTDQIGSGDIQLIPPQESIITMSAGEVATLIVKVSIPSDATDGTVEYTIIKAVGMYSDASDYVTIKTTVNSDLPYPSNWMQLGSDPTFPTPPERIDGKAFYYTNNGTHVFFRMAQASEPDTKAFLYSVYLDIKDGGLQVGSYNYDYLLKSNGFLYEWDGSSWINSGYITNWQVDSTATVLWTNLGNLSIETQEIHLLACITTKDSTLKDKVGPYTILKNNISEAPLILIPILSLAIFFVISRRTGKNSNTHERILR